MPTTPSFKDMPIWQRSMRLVAEIYQLTAQLPATERLGISSSLQQSAVTIPTLVAGGAKRGRSGFQDACLNARYHCAEVETLLLIIQQTYPTIPIDDLLAEIDELQHVFTDMARRLAAKQQPRTV